MTTQTKTKTQPLWWEDALPLPLADTPLPGQADVAIIGGGFAGLTAALELQRGGASVVLIDKQWPGYGACSRNLGLIVERIDGTTTGDLDDDMYGVPRHELIAEGQRAYDFVIELIQREQINCGLRSRGKLVLATTRSAYDKMAAFLERSERFFGVGEAYMIPRSELHSEIGGAAGDLYYGAKVLPNHHDVNPGQLTAGLVRALAQTDASICCETYCTAMERLPGQKFRITTNRGELVARHLVLTTQGYSGPETGFLNKRIFPFLAHVIATKPLAPGLLNECLPTGRSVVDTRQMFLNFRPCDQEQRLILASNYLRTDSDEVQARRIMRTYRKLFPKLADSDIEYCWHGNLALPGDSLPHIGIQNGVHYCATGSFSMALYLGSKMARRILNRDDAATVMDDIPLSNFPLYRGKPNMLYFMLRVLFGALDACRIAAPK